LTYGISLFIQSQSWRHGYLFVSSCTLSLLLIAEFFYYSYSTSFLQVSALKYANQALSVSGTIDTLVTPKIILFLFPPIVVVVSFFFSRSKKHTLINTDQKIAVGILIILLGTGGYGWLAAAETRELGSMKGLFTSPYDTNALVGKMGIANYFLEGVVKYAWHSKDVTQSDKAFVRDWNHSRPPTPPATHKSGIAKNRNIILIQIESLENSVLNTSIEGKEITPTLNALAKSGAYFSNYFAQIGHGTTADAEFMILNSLYSLSDGVAFVDYPKNSYRALPQFLSDNGYRTLVMHGDVATFWNRANIYPQLGYQTWIMKNDFSATREIGYQGLGDADFFSQSAEKLKGIKEPFMATLITLSSHTPFLLPDDVRTITLSKKSGLNETQRHYLESIHYADAAVGSFITELKKSGLYDRSLIIIYGDHGSFTDIGDALNIDKDLPKDVAHQHVPLIILAPGTELKGMRSLPASHIDMYPTVANLLGLTPPRTILGQDLFNTNAPVMTYRKPSANAIGYIQSDTLSYTAAPDGIFNHGSCSDKDAHTLPIEKCQNIYETQTAQLKVSDITIKADIIDVLTSEIKNN
ncbi:MAG: LTA synthase family protein, partial [Candidatus Uhrbacteria bacterium]|nr:LTA synthase family protein [Candidatus Uhrbacteria bacterium]